MNVDVLATTSPNPFLTGVLMEFPTLDQLKSAIDEMSLEDLRTSILVEMCHNPLFSCETSTYLLEAFEDRVKGLYT